MICHSIKLACFFINSEVTQNKLKSDNFKTYLRYYNQMGIYFTDTVAH